MRYPNKSHRHAVTLPSPSVELAEFIGIMLGDGGLSRYQVSISLNQESDSEFSEFVCSLIQELFAVTPSVYDRRNQLLRTLVISRTELVEYLHGLGLPIGNKVSQECDIPDWIRRDRSFLTACIRGLVDTDGSVFTHRYRVNGKWYAYKKLSFTSASQPLLHSVLESLISFGMHARIGSAKDVRIDSKADMERYFTLIGTSNPKHLRRYAF